MGRALLALAVAVLAAAPAPALAHPGDGKPQPASEIIGRASQTAGFTAPPATPRAECGPGSRPSPGLQGRVPKEAPDAGYTCNATVVGHEGHAGGFKVERFVDKAGHQCLYYDTTLVFPIQAIVQLQDGATGVAVVDVTDPAKPVRTETLVTPAMQTPHESLLVHQKRGLLAAVMGNPSTYPGFIDVYDLNADCRHPQLLSSAPVGVLGHESGWSPDGDTFYATSLFTQTVTAVDMTNPRVPVPLTTFFNPSHGFTVSADGNRGYAAGFKSGVITVDTSEIQARKPAPQVREISRIRWPTLSIPQVAIPIRLGGRPALVEVDEFSVNSDDDYLPVSNGQRVGGARLIDISDERNPRVISDMRLEVNQPEHRAEIANDPGAQFLGQGYASHYCGVPREDDPPLVACSFIASGLRVFDIRDPRNPREVAYFVAPPKPSPTDGSRSNYAMSKPAFDVARHMIWYSDTNSGLYGVRISDAAWNGTQQKPPVRCASKRNFLIRLPRGLKSARVTVDGKRVRTLKGKRLRARVDLRGKPKKVVVVRVRGRSKRTGGVVTQVRRYRTCTPGTRRP